MSPMRDRLLTPLERRFIFGYAILVVALLIVGGAIEDYRSCNRQVAVRRAVNDLTHVQQRFLLSAAAARRAAAVSGSGPQVKVDTATANEYLRLAGISNPIDVPSCGL